MTTLIEVDKGWLTSNWYEKDGVFFRVMVYYAKGNILHLFSSRLTIKALPNKVITALAGRLQIFRGNTFIYQRSFTSESLRLGTIRFSGNQDRRCLAINLEPNEKCCGPVRLELTITEINPTLPKPHPCILIESLNKINRLVVSNG